MYYQPRRWHKRYIYVEWCTEVIKVKVMFIEENSHGVDVVQLQLLSAHFVITHVSGNNTFIVRVAGGEEANLSKFTFLGLLLNFLTRF